MLDTEKLFWDCCLNTLHTAAASLDDVSLEPMEMTRFWIQVPFAESVAMNLPNAATAAGHILHPNVRGLKCEITV